MTMESVVLGVIVVLGFIVIWRIHWFISYGQYTKDPVEKDGEPWYETPAWLRLPLLVTYGFTSTSFLIFVLYNFDNALPQFPDFSFAWIEFIDALLGCLLVLVDYGAKHCGDPKRKYVTMALGFIVGGTVALDVFQLVQS